MGVELIIAGMIVAVIGGTWIAIHFSEAEKIKRTLGAASRWPLAELPENTQGRVVGRARAIAATLTAPFSGRDCVYYIVDVFDASDDSKAILFSEERGVPFVIEDDTGRALVDPDGARISLTFDRAQHSDHNQALTADQLALFRRHGRGDADTVEKKLIYREAVIAIGEPVAVLGSGIREPDPDATPSAGYRGALPTRLRFTGSPRYPLVISDHHLTIQD